MGTALFWIAWGIISFWALRTFYFSFSKERLENLRKTALGINLSVLILSFLPWLPPTLGSKNSLILAIEGNIFAILFLFFITVSCILFLTKNPTNFKMASISVVMNTFVLFALMLQIRPGTFTLSFFDMAPIIIFMLLLVENVVVLLLWQQLQLKESKHIIRRKN